MKRVTRKKTIENNPQFLTKSKKGKEDVDNVEVSVSIPIDLIIEILTKLPPKSIAKLICVSKLWYSTIRGKYFIDLFLTRSLTRPCFLIAFHRKVGSRVFSTPSTGQMVDLPIWNQVDEISQPIRGFICCHNASTVLICNPSTGQVLDLPKVKTRRVGVKCFFGYDHVNDVYKVLCMTVIHRCFHRPFVSEEHQVLTLGAGLKKTWRMIKCQHPHYPRTKGLFMNGVVYYGAWSNSISDVPFIVCFDVRLEEFSLVKTPNKFVEIGQYSELVNYHKKVAFLNQAYSDNKVTLWVLQYVKKQEWLEIQVVVVPLVGVLDHLYFEGTISTGEIIFAPRSTHHPFFVVYYDLKEHNARRVATDGTGGPFNPAIVFLDHVENPMIL